MNPPEYRPSTVQLPLFDPVTFETGPPPSPILADLRRLSARRRGALDLGAVA